MPEITDEMLSKIENKAADTAKKEKEFEVCPCCGERTLKKPITPSDELLDQFMACAITGNPFVQTYDLYGGRAHIDISNATQDISYKLTKAISALESFKHSIVDMTSEISTIQENMRIYACIVKVAIEAASGLVVEPAERVLGLANEIIETELSVLRKNTDDDKLRKLITEWLALMTDANSVSGLPRNVLSAAVRLHIHIYNILLESGFDKNFWSRIKLA